MTHARKSRGMALAALAATSLLAACETTGGYGAGPAGPAVFNADDFTWSQRQGRAAIEGRVDYARNGVQFACTGSVGLTPDTPYTRGRIQTLYGSTTAAAVPEAVVRSRNVPDPNADYRAFVRSEPCDGNRFQFSNLPDGGWFAIVPVSSGSDDRLVLMRYVYTRGGRVSLSM